MKPRFTIQSLLWLRYATLLLLMNIGFVSVADVAQTDDSGVQQPEAKTKSSTAVNVRAGLEAKSVRTIRELFRDLDKRRDTSGISDLDLKKLLEYRLQNARTPTGYLQTCVLKGQLDEIPLDADGRPDFDAALAKTGDTIVYKTDKKSLRGTSFVYVVYALPNGWERHGISGRAVWFHVFADFDGAIIGWIRHDE